MEYHSSSPPDSSAAVILDDLCLLALRFATGLPMIYFQGWHQSLRAWAFVWEKKSWSLVTQFQDLGFSNPGVFATSLTVLSVILPIGVITGVYTRICAFLLLVVMVFILMIPVELSGNLNAQTLLLYTGMSIALTLGGAGRISLDHALTRQKKK